jgi:hypothetical protein
MQKRFVSTCKFTGEAPLLSRSDHLVILLLFSVVLGQNKYAATKQIAFAKAEKQIFHISKL